ncbi:uncharacterized protein LOC122377225, partial [Amphibalanus amphitrite]|uniref:uncharacterized protein LOC122377225 n=1 Tax=Amphibalanus amphitrite TaxID=1232801 RepID=UPI001C907C4D
MRGGARGEPRNGWPSRARPLRYQRSVRAGGTCCGDGSWKKFRLLRVFVRGVWAFSRCRVPPGGCSVDPRFRSVIRAPAASERIALCDQPSGAVPPPLCVGWTATARERAPGPVSDRPVNKQTRNALCGSTCVAVGTETRNVHLPVKTGLRPTETPALSQFLFHARLGARGLVNQPDWESPAASHLDERLASPERWLQCSNTPPPQTILKRSTKDGWFADGGPAAPTHHRDPPQESSYQ